MPNPRLPALRSLSTLALLAAVAIPLSAAEARRVAVVLDPAPPNDAARAEATRAAALTVLGLGAVREDGVIDFAVVVPGQGAAEGLDAALRAVADWGERAGSPGKAAPVADARRWARDTGLVIHVGPQAEAGERRVALVVGGETGVDVLAGAHRVLVAAWKGDERVMVRGPSEAIRIPRGIAQVTVLAAEGGSPRGVDEPLFDWKPDGVSPARAWFDTAPEPGQVETSEPMIAVMTQIEVTVDGCPALGDAEVRYSVWPTGAAEGAIELRVSGAMLPQPLSLAGKGGAARLGEPLVGRFDISPRLMRKSRGGRDQEVVVGPALECRIWPAMLVTPRIEVVAGEADQGEIQVSFVDGSGAPVNAERVLQQGAVEVLVERGGVAGEPIMLAARDAVAVAPLPPRGDGLRLRIEPQRTSQRLLGRASITLPPVATPEGASPWLAGLLAGLLVVAVGGSWPFLAGWLVVRLPTAQVTQGELSVSLRGVLVNRLRIDGETVFPALAAGMHPVPLGQDADAPALIRLELVRGLTGVRLVAYVAEKGVVRTHRQRLDRLPWTLGDMTVELRA